MNKCPQKHFRIAGSGISLAVDKSLDIVKKLKLVGEPYEIFQKTALIKVCMLW